MLLSTYEDPNEAADFLLCDLEADMERLGALPAEAVSRFRDRAADIAAKLYEIASETEKEH